MRRVLALAALFAVRVLPQPPAEEVRAIAERAYVFAYPMVLMEYTRRGAELNRFQHAPAFPDASFRRVIRPNADTLYSSAWLDLSKEPVLIKAPDTNGRYYLLHFMDMWTETFTVPGKRTTGTGEGWFALVGPGWKGTLPARAKRIDSPANTVWLIGRVQTNNPADYANVHAIQRGFQIMPLSLYPDGPLAAAVRPGGFGGRGMPPEQVAKLSAADFFTTFASLLEQNPAHAEDGAMMAQLAKIGIERGKPFRAGALGPAGVAALEAGARAAMARIEAIDRREAPRGPTGWSRGAAAVGRYGTNYAVRAMVARIGLGALPPEDAVYMNCGVDSQGKPLTGTAKYRIHFAEGQLPPVKAFWSVTMYGDDGYFTPNPINRFAIGDRDLLKYNADGSLDLWVQRESPGKERESNWLPAAPGTFNLSLRLYWPNEEAASGKWTPPAVEAVP
jgi:hypothetical protein